ncbi:DUF4810 domain-containing protein [Erwinia sp. BNK-24-b]|uniref:DUF4810 domain-containing protein n=1 Tax=unclassified Erwinia TaxID=2622719 RepID=UPI0039BF76AC
MRLLKVTGMLATALLMTACAQKKEPVYYWGDYQSSLYSAWQNGSAPEKDIATLNKVIEQAKAKNKPLPPGLHAQLGLLYVNAGQPDKAFQQFTNEKIAFPESSAYMDFLMRNKQGAK